MYRLSGICALLIVVVLLASGCATTSNSLPLRPGTEAPPGQDVKLAVYNVAFGAIVGGLGAMVNGRDSPPARRFARGAGWGALGGGFSYMGKWQAGAISEQRSLVFGLPARLLHNTGLSVIENAAHQRPPFERLATHFGIVRFDFTPRSGALQARLLPFETLVFGLLLADPDVDFLLTRSLFYGALLFSGDGRATAPITGGSSNGRAILGAVFVNRQDDEFYDTAAHELVHAFQAHQMARVETVFRLPLEQAFVRSSAYRTLARWIYLDSPVLLGTAYYLIEGGDIDAPCKYNNWLEREAEAFASRRPVGLCR